MRKDVLVGRQEIAYESQNGPSILEFLFMHLADILPQNLMLFSAALMNMLVIIRSRAHRA